MTVKNILMSSSAAFLLWGCAGGDNPGLEYAPNMYHSVAYEAMSQITDEHSGWVTNALDNSPEDGPRRGEFFNSNKYNPFRMNMRMPPPHTVKTRTYGNWLPYRIGRVSKDSVPIVTAGRRSPLDSTVAIVAEGKALFEIYCKHCHGAKGDAETKIAEKFAGIANLKGDAYINITEAHIFHVITNGAGLMQSHGSQVSPEDRWKIAKYVKVLQKQK